MSVFAKRSVETSFGNIYLSTIAKIAAEGSMNPLILTLDEKANKIKHVPLKKIIYGEKPTMVVQCSSKHICCTPDHLILTSVGYVRADEIEIGDKILLDNLSYTYVTGLMKETKVRPVYDLYLDGGTNFTCFGLFVESAKGE